MARLKGTVEAIYFQNDTNFYKVLLVSIHDMEGSYEGKDIVVTGTFGHIHPDTTYIFEGELVTHAKYGMQFQSSRYEQVAISSQKGLIHYLSSDRFPGIGSVLAARIVDVFGEETIACIVNRDARLFTITGMTAKKCEQLIERLQTIEGENQTVVTLLQYGLSDKIAYRIYQHYQEETLQILQDNPYCLLESIEGLGFTKIDAVGEQLQFDANAPERLRGALFSALKELCYGTGNTYVEPLQLLQQAVLVLEKSRKVMVSEAQLVAELQVMAKIGSIIVDHDRIALPSLYYAEDGIVSRVKAMLSQEDHLYPKQSLDKAIQKIEKKLGITYDAKQKEALKRAVTAPLSILTGGPGTGKTTVLNGIIALFAQLNAIDPVTLKESNGPILLAAPTGRAAKRMKELTGLPAVTLHRLLGLGLNDEQVSKQFEIGSELEGALLIVDEMSMVDTWLCHWLFQAVPMGMQVVLVGDNYQLPSVSPGQVLHDLLDSNSIPATVLETIYRQDDDSTIVTLAHQVKSGVVPHDFTRNVADRSYFECVANQVPMIIEKVVTKAKQRGFTMKDIQVLAPMYKGNAGIDRLNTVIQNILNPNTQKEKRELEHFERLFRTGDKVLQLVNVPEKNVFNGDIGEISAILYADETEDNVDCVVVDFDGNEIVYPRSDCHQLTLAYCCSIHKAQGSEFPLVIMPLVEQYGRMLRRDLVYTAMTRSKRILILCGQESAFVKAIKDEGRQRQTLLKQKLIGTVKPDALPIDSFVLSSGLKEEATLYGEIDLDQIDPMINMAGVSPYDFM